MLSVNETNVDNPRSVSSITSPESSFSSPRGSVLSENKDDEKNKKFITALNASARSLGPKIESLADCMYEIGADLSVVTGTWLQDRGICNATIDLAGEHG